MATNPPPQPGADAFHRERSKCLDAFAALEESVILALAKSGGKSGGEPFGKKIEALKKSKPSPTFTKVAHGAVTKLVADIEPILDLRNDLVHARLQIAKIGEDQRACFINARQCESGTQMARLFSLDSLREVTRKASQIAEKLRAV